MKRPCILCMALLVWLGIAIPGVAADYTLTHREGNEFVFNNGTRSIRLQLCMPDMFRVTKSPVSRFEPDESWMVVSYNWPELSCTVN